MAKKASTSKRAVKASKADDTTSAWIKSVTDDKAALTRMINVIANRAAAQRESIRIAGPSAIEHAIKFGNATYLTKLFDAIGSESRRRDFVKWCVEFSPVRWIEGKTVDGVKQTGNFGMDAKRVPEYKAKLEKDRIAFLSPLVKLPYWEWAPEPEIEALSVPQLLAMAVKKIDNYKSDEKKAGLEGNDFAGEEDIRALAAKYPYIKKAKKADSSVTVH